MYVQKESIQPEIGSGPNSGNQDPSYKGRPERKRIGNRTDPRISREGEVEEITRMERARRLLEQHPDPNPTHGGKP
jgi:hypothetical protein